MTKPIAIIMAAGMGSRYKGLKQLDGVGPSNETLMDYSIFDAIQAGFERIVLVIRKEFEQECRELTGKRWENQVTLQYAFQDMNDIPVEMDTTHREKPWGTAHALLAARDYINAPFTIFNADDYYGRSAFEVIYQYLKTNPKQRQAAMVGYKLDQTLSMFGSVTRGICEVSGSLITEVNERKNVTKADGKITYEANGEKLPLTGDEWASMNFWGFSHEIVPLLQERFTSFLKEQGHEAKSEFLIPTVVNDLLAEKSLELTLLTSEAQWFGMTYQEDKPRVKGAIQKLVDEKFYPSEL
jgi:choline kinase